MRHRIWNWILIVCFATGVAAFVGAPVPHAVGGLSVMVIVGWYLWVFASPWLQGIRWSNELMKMEDRAQYVDHCRKLRVCCNCGYDLRATPDRCPECGTVSKTGEQTP